MQLMLLLIKLCVKFNYENDLLYSLSIYFTKLAFNKKTTLKHFNQTNNLLVNDTFKIKKQQPK